MVSGGRYEERARQVLLLLRDKGIHAVVLGGRLSIEGDERGSRDIDLAIDADPAEAIRRLAGASRHSERPNFRLLTYWNRPRHGYAILQLEGESVHLDFTHDPIGRSSLGMMTENVVARSEEVGSIAYAEPRSEALYRLLKQAYHGDVGGVMEHALNSHVCKDDLGKRWLRALVSSTVSGSQLSARLLAFLLKLRSLYDMVGFGARWFIDWPGSILVFSPHVLGEVVGVLGSEIPVRRYKRLSLLRFARVYPRPCVLATSEISLPLRLVVSHVGAVSSPIELKGSGAASAAHRAFSALSRRTMVRLGFET